MAEALYVGIDVSKAELVVAMRPSNERMTLANDRAGIKRLVGRLGELKPKLVVVEATGGLQRQMVAALWAAAIPVAAVNPSWVRSFAQGRGVRAKTDRKDAELLAAQERDRAQCAGVWQGVLRDGAGESAGAGNSLWRLPCQMLSVAEN